MEAWCLQGFSGASANWGFHLRFDPFTAQLPLPIGFQGQRLGLTPVRDRNVATMTRTTTRYGYYLRPSPAMSRAQTEIHHLLEHQFGLKVAGRFMPHATIKGFFRSDASLETIREAAATITAGREPFPVYSQGAVGFGDLGIALSIMRTPELDRNRPLQALHDAALTALMPLVADDCTFTAKEWLGDRFEAHLTLAMADLPAAHLREVLRFVQELEPVGPETFEARWCHLYAFESPHWNGPWWDEFDWRLIDSWELGAGPHPFVAL